MAQRDILKYEYRTAINERNVNINKDKSSEIFINPRAFSYSIKEKATERMHLPPSKLFTGTRFITARKIEEITPKSGMG
jgi:hypothetical protein